MQNSRGNRGSTRNSDLGQHVLLARWRLWAHITRVVAYSYIHTTLLSLPLTMPWHETSDTSLDGSLLHFLLGLNDQLSTLAGTAVNKYAFTGKTALMLLAASAQGRESAQGGYGYHQFTPLISEFSGKVRCPQERPTPTKPTPGTWMIDVRCIAYSLHLGRLFFCRVSFSPAI